MKPSLEETMNIIAALSAPIAEWRSQKDNMQQINRIAQQWLQDIADAKKYAAYNGVIK